MSHTLHELIHSLNSNEKRYFMQFAQTQGGRDKNYLKVYRVLEKMPVYNEKKFKIAITPNVSANRLAQAKIYLHDSLMQMLRQYHREKPNLLRLARLQDVILLREKGLAEVALQNAVKLKTEALEEEDYMIYAAAMDIEMNLMRSRLNAGLDEVFFYDAEKELLLSLSSLNITIRYQTLHAIRTSLTIKYGNSGRHLGYVNSMEKLVQHPLLQDVTLATTFRAQFYYYFIWRWYYLMKNNIEKAFEDASTLFNMFSDKPTYKRFAYEYIVACYFLAYSSAQANKISEYKEALAQLRSLKLKDVYLRYLQCAYEIVAIGQYNRAHKSYHKTQMAEPILNEIKQKYASLFNPNDAIMVNTYMAEAYLYANKYDKALDIINDTLNAYKHVLADSRVTLMLYRILIHARMRNWYYIHSLAKNLYYTIRKVGNMLEAEKLFVKLITSSNKLHSYKDWQSIITEYLPQFEKINNDKHSDSYKRYTFAIDYIRLLTKRSNKGIIRSI